MAKHFYKSMETKDELSTMVSRMPLPPPILTTETILVLTSCCGDVGM